MTGHQNAHGVVVVGHTHGPAGFGTACHGSHFGIAAGLPVGNLQQGRPYPFLERGTVQRQWNVEFLPQPRKIFVQFPGGAVQQLTIGGRFRDGVTYKVDAAQAVIVGAQPQQTHGGLVIQNSGSRMFHGRFLPDSMGFCFHHTRYRAP